MGIHAHEKGEFMPEFGYRRIDGRTLNPRGIVEELDSRILAGKALCHFPGTVITAAIGNDNLAAQRVIKHLIDDAG